MGIKKIFNLVVFIGFCQFVFAQTNWYYSITGEKKTLVAVDSLVFYGGKFCNKLTIQKSAANKQQQQSKPCMVYATKNRELKSISNKIIVKVKENYSISEVIKQVQISEVKITEHLPNFFEITIGDGSDVFVVSRSFYESKMVDFAIPDFTCTSKLHSYNSNQWGIKNMGHYSTFDAARDIDINLLNAWRITKGDSTIKIALLDTGVKLSHADLRNNLLPGYTDSLVLAEDSTALNNGDYYPGDNHGTHCAGIIVAEDNGIGITGVAPQCKLIPIRMHSQYSHEFDKIIYNESSILRCFNYAYSQGADVYSCSWESNSEIIEPVINFVSTHGRNGKGAIVIFSSGNDNHSNVNNPSEFASTISVGAITPTGLRWFQDETHASNYGVGLDLVAPGENILTTSSDKNPNPELAEVDTIAYDGMTSMAAPFVSGVAALLLSVNPDLTAQQVKHALFSTCKKLSNYTYTTVSGKPHGTWEQETGYGLVNAYNAVMSLLNIEGPNIVESSTQTFSIPFLPSSATVDWEITGTSFLRFGSTSGSILVTNYALNQHNSFNATIRATVHLANGSNVLLTKDIYFLYSGVQSSNDNLYGSFTSTEGQCWLDPIPYNADDFQWSIDNGWMVEGGNGDGSCYFYTRSGFPYSGLATVTVEYKDASGNPSSISKQFHIDMGDEYGYCIYPNPATSTIQITSSSAIKKALENGGDKEIRAYEIFSNTGLQVAKRIYTEKVNETTIDISTLKPGNYYLRIYDGKKWHGQPLIVDKK